MNIPTFIDKYNIYDIFYVNDHVHIITPTPSSYDDKMCKLNISCDEQVFYRTSISSLIYRLRCDYKEYINLRINDENISHVKVNKYPDFNNDVVLATMVKNEDNYIVQWIEYHLYIGFTKFIIYDNSSSVKTIYESDNHSSDLQNVLKEYIEKGVLALIEWKYPFTISKFNRNSGQLTQQNHALKLSTKSRYTGFFDIDEYINITRYGSNVNSIVNLLDNILLNSNNSGVRIWCKFMQNPLNKETKGYEFLKITEFFYSIQGNHNEPLFNNNNSPKVIVIPSRTSNVSIHTYKEKRPYSFFEICDYDSIYFNHYYFLNKSNRKGWRNGRNCKFYDDSLVTFYELLNKSKI